MSRPEQSDVFVARGASKQTRRARVMVATLVVSSVAIAIPIAAAGGGGGPTPLPTTPEDFFQAGTQPIFDDPSYEQPINSNSCRLCHANYDPENEPFTTWAASMLGQSARDPLFRAGLSIANQDAEGAGEFCMRCHTPVAFLTGKAADAEFDNFTPLETEGVNCAFCHRLVDPVDPDGVAPPQDAAILADLMANGLMPPEASNARFVLDPEDDRRGPFDDLPENPHIVPFGTETVVSPFHQTAELCWTCHDVSNPLMERQPDNTYDVGALGMAHSTDSQDDQFPLHRTYSEWKNSYYSSIGVQHEGRFGGNHPTGVMKSCQDCHMPDQEAFGCGVGEPFFERPDMPQHSFVGANTWVLRAVRDLYPDNETHLTEKSVDAAIARNMGMLEKASDLTVEQEGTTLTTRVINRGGHKLPTGFPDGRRIWVNVQFLDGSGALVEEFGAYDFDEAELIGGGDDTKVYEAKLGITPDLAAQVGQPAGETFHFALANEILKDNRIPPAGWSSVIAETDQTAPVGATYVSGQHWDDTEFDIPSEAREAVVIVYHQLTSREFIEYLRDENITDDRGQTAYDQWVLHGKSAPTVMDMVSIEIFGPADFDMDGLVGFSDLIILLSLWGSCPADPFPCPTDLSGDGVTGFDDLLALLSAWEG